MPFEKGRKKTGGRQRKPTGPRIEIVYRVALELKPYERNPRKNDKAVDRMCASIKEYGFTVPVLIRSNGDVIDGHLRLKGAIKLAMLEVPCIVCDSWTPAQVKEFRLMANRSVNWADWDVDALAAEFADLKALDFDLSLTGFDSREIDGFMLQSNPAEDDVPPVPEVPRTKLGDLWLLGEHRLLCGDSTNADNVSRLLGGRKPFLMVTDPPYGVEYDAEWRGKAGHASKGKNRTGKVENDNRADWREAWLLFPGAVAYVWHGALHSSDVAISLIECGFKIRSQIIWKKTVMAMSRGDYHWMHEPCWYAVKNTGRWEGDRKQTTIWEAASPIHIMGGSKEEKTPHPTQKPVELMRRSILNHTVKGDAVYDPFLGSGTTLIAAESTERICYGLEISPAYCDVIVSRWEKLTGKKATLESTGEVF
jgi:DNA modification methylase